MNNEKDIIKEMFLDIKTHIITISLIGYFSIFIIVLAVKEIKKLNK